MPDYSQFVTISTGNVNVAYETVFHHTKHEKIPYTQDPKLAVV
jgi:hypothetical protein